MVQFEYLYVNLSLRLQEKQLQEVTLTSFYSSLTVKSSLLSRNCTFLNRFQK